MWLPVQTYLYSATAAAVVQSRLREPCSVYYVASFYVQQKISSSFVLLAPDPGEPLPMHQRLSWIDTDSDVLLIDFRYVVVVCYSLLLCTGLYIRNSYWRIVSR